MERNPKFEELSSEWSFAELLGKAEPRPVPPAADEALIRNAVHAEWQNVVGRKVRRRRTTALALAASILIAIVATLSLVTDPAGDITRMRMAAIEKQLGDVSINSRRIYAGQIAAIGGSDVVETGPASVLALGWHDGGSLRLDQNTSVVFEASQQIYLREGRVYFDSEKNPLTSPADSGAARLVIRTDHGVARHLGTQYMTQVDSEALVISVREGIVSIDGSVTALASVGQQFAISPSGELSITHTNGVDGWEWVEKSTPSVNLENRSVADALAWVSRESGRRISYPSQDAEVLANKWKLYGIDVRNLPPSRALEVFMMTVDLNARIEGEVIVVSED